MIEENIRWDSKLGWLVIEYVMKIVEGYVNRGVYEIDIY